ncbi:hypothetical protein BDW42DRAFT_130197 [Aspergillus taichungensis]|uniref:Uncharacterized protein n=1 Tax=Aspergillus taichungensis TaxID=482145 RepID=A0A2J5HPR7_9EURO|nr:hypothetical protein BDW42DRAFT_130197 [Aspergillus taichungensis]
MGTTSVRRNLFHHHLSRRPVPATTPDEPMQNGGANGKMSDLSSRMLTSTSSGSTSSLSSGPVDNGEIVTRDQNGAYQLDTPVLPPVSGDTGDEMEGVEEGPSGAGADSTAQTEIGTREKEKIEASLVEMMCRNRNRQMSNEPAEILNLIQQSLRNKVAALQDDNWMYEPEANSRV